MGSISGDFRSRSRGNTSSRRERSDSRNKIQSRAGGDLRQINSRLMNLAQYENVIVEEQEEASLSPSPRKQKKHKKDKKSKKKKKRKQSSSDSEDSEDNPSPKKKKSKKFKKSKKSKTVDDLAASVAELEARARV